MGCSVDHARIIPPDPFFSEDMQCEICGSVDVRSVREPRLDGLRDVGCGELTATVKRSSIVHQMSKALQPAGVISNLTTWVAMVIASVSRMSVVRV